MVIHKAGEDAGLIGDDAGTELAANRTAMAFERTAMASDRTLMAIVRTALALIGFGFTIFQFFHTLDSKYLKLPDGAPRRFGLTLIILGVVLLTLGIFNHAQEARERRRRRLDLYDRKLMHHYELTRPSSAMVIAILLLMVGLMAITSVGLSVGPF